MTRSRIYAFPLWCARGKRDNLESGVLIGTEKTVVIEEIKKWPSRREGLPSFLGGFLAAGGEIAEGRRRINHFE